MPIPSVDMAAEPADRGGRALQFEHFSIVGHQFRIVGNECRVRASNEEQ